MAKRTAGEIASLVYNRRPLLDPATGRPYQQEDRSWFKKWVQGSGFAAALLPFVVTLLIWIAECALFDFVFEDRFPDLFPVSGDFNLPLFSLLVFALSLRITQELSFLFNKNIDYSVIAGNTNTLAWFLTTFVRNSSLDFVVPKCHRYVDPRTVQRVDMPLYEVMHEINLATRALTWAQLLELTLLKKQKDPLDETSFPDNLRPTEVRALGLSDNLEAELIGYVRSRSWPGEELAIADAVYRLVTVRVAWLQNYVGFPDGTEQRLYGEVLMAQTNAQISGLSTNFANLQANRINTTTPMLESYLFITVYAWALVSPLLLWGSYRWWTLLVSLVYLYPVLAAYYVGGRLRNQFNSYNDTPYQIHDMKKVMLHSAAKTDAIFDAYYRENQVSEPVQFKKIV